MTRPEIEHQSPGPFANTLLINQAVGLMSWGLANGPGNRSSIPSRVLDASLLNTQHYKVHIKGKVEQHCERSSAPPAHLSVVAIEKWALGLHSTAVANLYIKILIHKMTSTSLQKKVISFTFSKSIHGNSWRNSSILLVKSLPHMLLAKELSLPLILTLCTLLYTLSQNWYILPAGCVKSALLLLSA